MYLASHVRYQITRPTQSLFLCAVSGQPKKVLPTATAATIAPYLDSISWPCIIITSFFSIWPHIRWDKVNDRYCNFGLKRLSLLGGKLMLIVGESDMFMYGMEHGYHRSNGWVMGFYFIYFLEMVGHLKFVPIDRHPHPIRWVRTTAYALEKEIQVCRGERRATAQDGSNTNGSNEKKIPDRLEFRAMSDSVPFHSHSTYTTHIFGNTEDGEIR